MKKISKVKRTLKPKKKVSKKQPKTTIPSRCSCEEAAANEILKRNMAGDPKLNKESADFLFARSFILSLLKEQDEVDANVVPAEGNTPDDFTPEKNQEDFENSLEKETNPDDFNIEGIPSDVTLQIIGKVKEWALKLNDFEEFLNDPSDTSLHRILADNDRSGSLLRGITRKASDSITRIAGEIAKLKEILNTFVNTAPKKLRDTEQLKLGS